MSDFDWDEFEKGFMYARQDGFTAFISDPDNIRKLYEAPAKVLKTAERKAARFGIELPRHPDLSYDADTAGADPAAEQPEAPPEPPEQPEKEPEPPGPAADPEDKQPPTAGADPDPAAADAGTTPARTDGKERFVCNRYPNYSIMVGNTVAQFRGGTLITDDKAIIDAVVADPWFNLFIFADNPEIRARKQRRR